VRGRDPAFFLIDTVSNILFMVLALIIDPAIWLLYIIVILDASICIHSLRGEYRELGKITSREMQSVRLFHEIKNHWEIMQLIAFIIFIIVVWFNPEFLLIGFVFLVFRTINTYDELGKILARIIMKNRT